jgi:hypothetical protein
MRHVDHLRAMQVAHAQYIPNIASNYGFSLANCDFPQSPVKGEGKTGLGYG